MADDRETMDDIVEDAKTMPKRAFQQWMQANPDSSLVEQRAFIQGVKAGSDAQVDLMQRTMAATLREADDEL